jgi:5-methylcytosine-specific restriction endonuclease McrA
MPYKSAEAQADYHRRYREKNLSKLRAYGVVYNRKNRTKRRASAAKHRAANLHRIRADDVARYAKNRSRIKAYQADYRTRNKYLVLSYKALYRKENCIKIRADNAKRRALKASQVCTCRTREQIAAEFYSFVEHGITEIDHIVPLALGGLHCRKNLQLLTVLEHKAKTALDQARIAAFRRAKKAGLLSA